MKTRFITIATLIVSFGLSTAQAGNPGVTAKAFEQCRDAAQTLYGNDEEQARVRLDGSRKAGTELKMRVFTPEGELLRA